VLPHGAGLHEVLREAEALEIPLRVAGSRHVDGRSVDLPAPVVSIDHPGVQVSAVKRADDGSGNLIVRLYEACGDRASVAVRLPSAVRAAQRCSLLEEPFEELDVADGFVSFALRPFELVTLRLAAV
jgi:alpha-mannosidase